ncbi:MAG: metallophosphoesterase [Deltaproteobacteria bacterium]|jgi:predicted MPP superfamily phosphohydrolase|nr:metallophosphoesterase [Deltaproteobacteria bacterium]
MFLAVFCLLALSLVYTPWRMKRWLGWKRFWPLSAAALVWTAGYLALIMTGAYTLDSRLFAVLFVALGLLVMLGVYAFFGTLFLELSRLAVKGRKAPPKTLAWVVYILTPVLVFFGFINSQLIWVTSTTIEVPGLAKAVTLVHAPDMHLGPARGAGFLKRVLALIAEFGPDFVLYNGDLVDGNIALKPEIFDQFKDVKARQYFTTGNHEYYVNTEEVLRFVDGAGIRILLSESVPESGLNLIGMHYMNADLTTNQGHRVNDLGLDRELPKISRDPSLPDLLVHHSPVGLQYADRDGIEVYLAGHTHGGQVFPGTLLIRRNFPYYKGRYDIGNVKLLVSQGVGTFGPVMRLGTVSELQLVTLVPAHGSSSAPAPTTHAALPESATGSSGQPADASDSFGGVGDAPADAAPDATTSESAPDGSPSEPTSDASPSVPVSEAFPTGTAADE